MTLSEKYGDHNTPHRKIYGAAVADIGLDQIRKLIPWSKEELKEVYHQDEHFNSISIDKWDRIAGYSEDHRTGFLSSFGSPLKRMLISAGVDCFSCSELVCVLKEAALQIVEEVN